MRPTDPTPAPEYVVTLAATFLGYPSELNGLRRMDLDNARRVHDFAARQGCRTPRIVRVDTLTVVQP